MKSIYLLSFLLVLASANLAIDYSIFPDPSGIMFPCLAEQGVTLAIFEIFDEKGNVNQNFLVDSLAAKAANIKNVDAIIRVNDAFAPEDVCNAVAHALPEQFNGNVWFDVIGKQSSFVSSWG